jgi:hypothetical protein
MSQQSSNKKKSLSEPQGSPTQSTKVVEEQEKVSLLSPPQQYALELDQLHSQLLAKFTKAQEQQQKQIQKLKSELEDFRQEIQNLAVENYATSVVWSGLVDERIRIIQREQRERQKLNELLQIAKRKEIETQRRKAAQVQHKKDQQDFGTSSYYAMALLRAELRESEMRRFIESSAFQSQTELSQNFAKGYDALWKRFALKMEREMKSLEALIV